MTDIQRTNGIQPPRLLGATTHSGEQIKTQESLKLLRQVDAAIRMGNDRIGHGVILGVDPKRLVELGQLDPKDMDTFMEYRNELIKQVRDRGIVIELNISSNLKISDLELLSHPIAEFNKLGLRMTVNTDDEAVLATTVVRELQYFAASRGVRYADVVLAALEAINSRLGTFALKNASELKATYREAILRGLNDREAWDLVGTLAKRFLVPPPEKIASKFESPQEALDKVLDKVMLGWNA